ncbi:hypothetical protein [Noviherbaspirillum album]|nr:hypothetical protein [Noviherbaspirillum sp. CPCC 100848]
MDSQEVRDVRDVRVLPCEQRKQWILIMMPRDSENAKRRRMSNR